MQFKYHCFISYTTREREVRELKPHLDRLLDELRSAGVTHSPVFYDGFHITSPIENAIDLQRQLANGISESGFVIAVLSPGYVTSDWCIFEWHAARALHALRGHPAPGFSILPVVWKKPDLCYPMSVPADMREVQWWRMHANERETNVPELGNRRHLLYAIGMYLDVWFPEEQWWKRQPFESIAAWRP